MNRIQNAFKNTQPYIGYLMAGDGGIDKTLQAALALIAGGVNMLEIGVPFSDPIADGPVIQRAAQRALVAGTTLDDVLDLVKKLRQHTDIPLILFSYLNPIYAALNRDIFAKAKLAGIDGVLIVDCPLEEAKIYYDACIAQKIDPIYVISPVTPKERIAAIDHQGKGFLYYACRKGTTGVRNELPSDFAEKLAEIKNVAHLPVAVGFGISQPEMVKQVLQHADGFVVGSLFVKALEDGLSMEELTKLAASLV
ncbi:MAG: tryptophan synthase subunit alpha [Gammaproteobacteria bacterium]